MANGLAGDVVTADGPRDAARRSSSRRRWTATCGRTRRRSRTSAGCARRSATRSSRRSRGPLASGQSGDGPPRRAAGRSSTPWSRRSPAGRSASPTPTARPPLAGPAPREADLVGRSIVITAGGTREPIDPVRYIGNRSTGKMGVALAEAALARGARRHAHRRGRRGAAPRGRGDRPRRARPPSCATRSRAAMRPTDARRARRAGHGRRGRRLHAGRARRSQDPARRRPDPGADADAGPARRGRQRRPAEAARAGCPCPGARRVRGRDRLARPGGRPSSRSKGIDLLVANDVSEAGSGFGTETNRVTILDRAGAREELPLLPKREVADRVLDRVAHALDARDAAAQTAGMQRADAVDERDRGRRPPAHGVRHRPDVRRRRADPDAHRLRLPDRADPRRRRASR